MTLQNFQGTVIAYAIDEVIPNLPTQPINILGFNIPIPPDLLKFGAGVGATMSTFSIEKYAPQLKMAGILSENNEIDTDKLIKGMTDTMTKMEKVKVGDFEFDINDVNNFAKYLTP